MSDFGNVKALIPKGLFAALIVTCLAFCFPGADLDLVLDDSPVRVLCMLFREGLPHPVFQLQGYLQFPLLFQSQIMVFVRFLLLVSMVFHLAMLMVAVFPLFVSKAFPLEM